MSRISSRQERKEAWEPEERQAPLQQDKANMASKLQAIEDRAQAVTYQEDGD